MLPAVQPGKRIRMNLSQQSPESPYAARAVSRCFGCSGMTTRKISPGLPKKSSLIALGHCNAQTAHMNNPKADDQLSGYGI